MVKKLLTLLILAIVIVVAGYYYLNPKLPPVQTESPVSKTVPSVTSTPSGDANYTPPPSPEESALSDKYRNIKLADINPDKLHWTEIAQFNKSLNMATSFPDDYFYGELENMQNNEHCVYLYSPQTMSPDYTICVIVDSYEQGRELATFNTPSTTDVSFNGYKAKLMQNLSAAQTPEDELLVFVPATKVSSARYVLIIYPKKNIEAYLKRNNYEQGFDLVGYKNVTLKIENRLLGSIRFL